ncbi:MAG: glycosyltransferase family A protein, partial [Deltaproteobacteria bacterium]
SRPHPVNDYQVGSIREEFDFGPVTLVQLAAVRESIRKWGALADSPGCGWYDVRLKVSLDYPVFHLRELLYAVTTDTAVAGQFTYVDPRNYSLQKALEEIATAHLRRLGACLAPVFCDLPHSEETFQVEASVVIPVRNRVHTIAEAVQSAMDQETDFPFNVLVVDNHSSDGTTAVLAEMANQHAALCHEIPLRRDLTIGGCWNEAVFSGNCGRYAVQLDSDDLYSSPHTLQKIVDLLRSGQYAMVIGSYTLVNSRQEEIPPGLIDHREWTEVNGRNNALRINGFGAPRAFNTSVLRQNPFLNVGYGEDYAMALRLSRQYRIGRIYENLYWCRRWEGNSDAALTITQKNQYDAFKDQLRTLEIMARQELNGHAKQ